jgi:hypothetical protein
MTGLTPNIIAVAVVRHGVLRLTFADGLMAEVDVLDRMRGPVFGSARTEARVRGGGRRRGVRDGHLAGRRRPCTRCPV